MALLAVGVGTATAGAAPSSTSGRSAVRVLARRGLAHGRLPDGQTFTIIGERYRSRGHVHFKLAVLIKGSSGAAGAGFNPSRSHAVLAFSAIAVNTCSRSYDVVFGLLRARSDVILVRRGHHTSALRRASIPAALHAHGVLVYGELAAAPGAVIVRGPDGKRHSLRRDGRLITVMPTGCEGAPAGCVTCDAPVATSANYVSSPNIGSGDNFLEGVAAPSGSDAWAVGYYSDGGSNQALIEHWNGNGWSIASSPSPGGEDTRLLGVAATSASDVWAVGPRETSGGDRTLIEHWNGSAWTIIPSPNTGNDSWLFAVAAVSANDAWAVGTYSNGSVAQPLVEHWDGNAWSIVSSPSPSSGTDTRLTGVAASATNAWAVGWYQDGAHMMTLLERWNGTAWQVGSPMVGQAFAVTAVSASDARAVGDCSKPCHGPVTGGGLVDQWNGTAWQIQPSQNSPPQTWANFFGIAADSPSDAWAVGDYPDFVGNSGPFQTLVEHWNGNSWSIVPSPSPGPTDSELEATAAVSTNDAWAVGYYSNGSTDRTLIEHWNGSAWLG